MAKRGQGEGTISKRPNGTWWARVTIGKDENGKQKRQAFYGKTRKEVQEKLAAAVNGVNNGTYIEPSKMTVGEWIDVWLKDYKYMSVRPVTYMGLYSAAKNHVKPALGGIKLKDLRNDAVQKFVNGMVANGLSPNTAIDNYRRVLKASLEQAVINGLIPRNVAIGVRLPQSTKPEIKVLTEGQQEEFIALARTYDNGELFILILATGLRLGEVLALVWDDIDFEKEELRVNKTQIEYYDPHSEVKKRIIQHGPPKTRTSNRTVPLVPNAVQLLKQLKVKQDALKREVGSAYEDNNLLFCGLTGKPLLRNSMQPKFQRIATRIGINGLHIHCLRHTFATRGLENGIELKVMQDLLGHASIAMTADTYSHVLPNKKKESILKLDDTIKI